MMKVKCIYFGLFLVLLTLLQPKQVLAEPQNIGEKDRAQIEELIYEFGPYPRILAITLSPELSVRDKSWEYHLVKQLAEKKMVVIDEKAEALHWQPEPGTETLIRRNMDRAYRTISFSLILGTKDAKVERLEQVGENSLVAEIKETISENGLYRKISAYIPVSFREKQFTAKRRMLNFSRDSGLWTLANQVPEDEVAKKRMEEPGIPGEPSDKDRDQHRLRHRGGLRKRRPPQLHRPRLGRQPSRPAGDRLRAGQDHPQPHHLFTHQGRD